jgi:hypothetical protein
MFEPGEKVVCVDDRIHPEVACLYSALPKKGDTYTVRECEPGRAKWVSAQKGWDSVDMKVLLVELVSLFSQFLFCFYVLIFSDLGTTLIMNHH